MKPQRPDGTLELDIINAPVAQVVARDTHNVEVAGSSPAGNTTEPTLAQMMQIATQGNNIDVLERLVALKEREDARIAEREFAVAMNACQDEMPTVVRDAKNESSNSRYARMETIARAIKPVYIKHGFSLSFESPKAEGSKITIRCNVMHVGGHSRPVELSGDLDTTGPKGNATKTAIQGLGSTVSYLKRYLTCMIFNVTLANEDKDGNAPEQFITMEQANWIEDALISLGTDRKAFLGWANVTEIDKIKAKNYPDVYNTLMAKLRQKGAK